MSLSTGEPAQVEPQQTETTFGNKSSEQYCTVRYTVDVVLIMYLVHCYHIPIQMISVIWYMGLCMDDIYHTENKEARNFTDEPNMNAWKNFWKNKITFII